MNSLPVIRGIDHVHVFVADRTKAQQWYLRVLGFMPTEALQVWAADGGPLTLQNPQGTVHVALFERAHAAREALDAAVRQFGEWGNTDEGRHILIAVARYLAAHSPTERAELQTAEIARRLMRGGELHREATA